MKLKHWIMGTLLGISSTAGMSAETSSSASSDTAAKKEIKAKKVRINVRLKNDSIVDSSEDTLHTAFTDSINRDSLVHAKFKAAEYDMLCLVAHCEGVKLKAYFDKKARIWTIGFGNTIRPDGRKVTAKDRIRSEDELLKYFSGHINKYMFDDMKKYLPLDKMTSSEIAVIGSFIYNCGTGVLRDKRGNPTRFAQNLSDYILTRSEESKEKVKAYMDTKVTSRGQVVQALKKRRELEERILFGDLVLDNKGELNLENSVNFAEVSLGGIYSIGREFPADSASLANRLEEVRGRNLNDSIQHAIKSAALVKTKRSRGR